MSQITGSCMRHLNTTKTRFAGWLRKPRNWYWARRFLSGWEDENSRCIVGHSTTEDGTSLINEGRRRRTPEPRACGQVEVNLRARRRVLGRCFSQSLTPGYRQALVKTRSSIDHRSLITHYGGERLDGSNGVWDAFSGGGCEGSIQRGPLYQQRRRSVTLEA